VWALPACRAIGGLRSRRGSSQSGTAQSRRPSWRLTLAPVQLANAAGRSFPTIRLAQALVAVRPFPDSLGQGLPCFMEVDLSAPTPPPEPADADAQNPPGQCGACQQRHAKVVRSNEGEHLLAGALCCRG
jgi:hypothetical protein